MSTKFVRAEYSVERSEKTSRYYFRLIKNLKYSEFFTDVEVTSDEWKLNFSKIFIQSNFHLKYDAIKMIGKGSFARVYLVEDNKNKNQFAVKAFSKEYLLNQSTGKESLINEIEIMQNLNHKNVMKLWEVHESNNSIYLVMELLKGGELFEQISKKKKIQVDDVRHILGNLLEALVYLQEKGIMHRDLKPENMIL